MFFEQIRPGISEYPAPSFAESPMPLPDILYG